jgi:hypothetical protein
MWQHCPPKHEDSATVDLRFCQLSIATLFRDFTNNPNHLL